MYQPEEPQDDSIHQPVGQQPGQRQICRDFGKQA
jgi:hypothetical protein